MGCSLNQVYVIKPSAKLLCESRVLGQGVKFLRGGVGCRFLNAFPRENTFSPYIYVVSEVYVVVPAAVSPVHEVVKGGGFVTILEPWYLLSSQ